MSVRPTLRLLIGLTLALAACGPRTTPAPTQVPATEAPAATGSPTETPPAVATPTPITMTDGLDRQVTFDQPPRRIVIAGRATPLLADAIFLFPEAQERIVAVEARAQRVAGFLTLVDPAFRGKAALEMDASAEQILPFEPDLVIMKSFMADSLGDPLTELGIPVVYLDLETPEQYSRDLAALGQVFNNPARAEELQAYFAERTERVRDLTSVASEGRGPRVLLMQYSQEGGEVSVEVPSTSWLQTQLVTMANGEPVWEEAAPGGGWTIVGFEQIAAWDPAQIYVVDYFGDSSMAVEALVADPNWATLTAVQDNRIHAFPADHLSWDQPDPRWILGLQWVATQIHPEVAEGIDLAAEVRGFFAELYGLDEATIEAEVLPLITGDIET